MGKARNIPLEDTEDLARAYGGRPDPGTRGCDVPGCEAAGEHRAPKSPDKLNEHYWFCLAHVQAYNRKWNYYAGMSENEVEAHIRRDTTWQRPTWKFGGRTSGPTFTQPWEAFDDGYEVLEDEGPRQEHAKTRREKAGGPPVTGSERRALEVLELDGPVDLATLKARYKALVKLYHPDANGGDAASEERLKLINHAYTTLKKRIRA